MDLTRLQGSGNIEHSELETSSDGGRGISAGHLENKRLPSLVNDDGSIGVGENSVKKVADKFMLRLTASLAQRVRDRLDKEHTMSPNEVKLLEYFVKQIKQNKKNNLHEDELEDKIKALAK